MNRSSHRGRPERLHDYNGDLLSLVELAALHGVERRTIESRLSRGWSVVDAATTPTRPRAGGWEARRYAFDGRDLTIAEWSKISGIRANTISSRLRIGWTIGRAVTERAQLNGMGPRKRGGGYVPTSWKQLGTGGGRSAQDRG